MVVDSLLVEHQTHDQKIARRLGNLLGPNHMLPIVTASVMQVSYPKINLQYLKKADQVTKQIPWGSFQFEVLNGL